MTSASTWVPSADKARGKISPHLSENYLRRQPERQEGEIWLVATAIKATVLHACKRDHPDKKLLRNLKLLLGLMDEKPRRCSPPVAAH